MHETGASASLGQLRTRVPAATPHTAPLDHIYYPVRPFQASFGPESPLLANAAPGDAIEIELSGGGQELHIKDVRLRASQQAHSFTSPPPPSCLGTARGWLLDVLRAAHGEGGHSQGGEAPGGEAPGGRARHCLGCSSELLSKSPFPPPVRPLPFDPPRPWYRSTHCPSCSPP